MTKEGFLRMFEETVMAPPHSITGNEPLDQLKDWDSLAVMAFVAQADEHFSLTVSHHDLSWCQTVNDLWEFLTDRIPVE